MYSQNKGVRLLRGALTVILSSVITGMALMFYIPTYINKNYTQQQKISYQSNIPQSTQVPSSVNIQSGTPAAVNGEVLDISSIAAKVIPSVVGVSTSSVSESTLFHSNQQQTWSVGSGVIVSSDGYILTNHHVIGNSPSQIVVTLANGQTINAKSEWSDSTLDLAVIKIDATGMAPAILGDATQIKVGETAVAIGNPLGLQFQRTVTAGIISAVNRTISVNTDGKENYMEGLIQTDASINPGNSGGPLINSKGEVVGINTIKVSSAEGMGFAIPINIAKPVITGFVEKGQYATPYMGLYAYDTAVTEYVKQDASVKKGVYVSHVDTSSPIYQAGIRVGDIITHMDDKEVNTMMQLRIEMFKCGVGANCKIRYIRNGNTYEAKLSLQNRVKDGLLTR